MNIIHLTKDAERSILLWREVYEKTGISVDWIVASSIDEFLWLSLDRLDNHPANDILYIVEQPTVAKLTAINNSLNFQRSQLLIVSTGSQFETFGEVCRKSFLADRVQEKITKGLLS